MAVVIEGLAPHEMLAVRAAYAVFDAIDWKDGQWKTAGKAVYERFRSRLVVAAREAAMPAFVERLARKCGVAVPRIDADLFASLGGLDAEPALRFARENPGVLVAALRLFKESVRAS